jgi:hypothetical protein
MRHKAYTVSLVLALFILLNTTGNVSGAVSFSLGNRYSLDTRPRPTEPGFGLGPAFELSTLQFRGQVLTNDTPLEGATIAAGGLQIRTDANGRFALAGVRPRQLYTLTAFAPGFDAFQQDGVSAEIGRSVSNLVFRLEPAAEIYTLVALWPAADDASSVMQGGAPWCGISRC